MEIYLVRHTTPKVDKGVCYGQSDLDITESFNIEYERLSKHLPEEIHNVYSSPLRRCKLVAERVADQPLFDNRLMEMNFGDWELCQWSNINKEELNNWMSDFVTKKPPKGESFLDVQKRVLDFWDYLINSESDKPTVVTTHGGVIRTIVCHLLGVSLDNAFKFHLDYGSVTKVASHNQEPRVEYINR